MEVALARGLDVSSSEIGVTVMLIDRLDHR
jgi:hypothetical protein